VATPSGIAAAVRAEQRARDLDPGVYHSLARHSREPVAEGVPPEGVADEVVERTQLEPVFERVEGGNPLGDRRLDQGITRDCRM